MLRIEPEENCRYWIGVVSAAHVKKGVEDGFAQLCHGKAAPLRRMRPGDWLIYYSPSTELGKGEKLQAFTAIGRVVGDRVYEYPMSDSFVPFRRDVHYYPCRVVPISELLHRLSFTAGNPRWGYALRFGHLEIEAADFRAIASLMLEDEVNAEPGYAATEERYRRIGGS